MTNKEEHLVENEEILDQDVIEDQDLEETDEVEESEEDTLEEMDVDVKSNGTEAAATLRPNSKPAGTKSEMMTTLVQAMSGMSGGDMIKFFNMAMGAAKEFPEKIPDGTAEKNKGSIAAKGKPVKEDLESLFGDDSETLSEELKDKMSTLFEAAVATEVEIQTAKLEEQFEEKLKEEINSVTEDLKESLDQYLDHVAGEWLQQNQASVEQNLRTDLAESFINDLGELCRHYRMDLPEGQDDVIETLVDKVDKLEEALNASETREIELKEEMSQLHKQAVIEQVADELSPIHYKKFKTLAENIEFEGDEEKFVKKLEYIKEGFFGTEKSQKTPSTKIINEQIAEDAEDAGEDKQVFLDPAVKNIYDAISRTTKI